MNAVRITAIYLLFHLAGPCRIDERLGAVCASFEELHLLNESVTEVTLTGCHDDVSVGYRFPEVRNVTLGCTSDKLFEGFADVFPKLENLHVPKCALREVPWQAFYVDSLVSADLSECPLACSCSHLWLMAGSDLSKVVSPAGLTRCTMPCAHGNLTFAQKVVTAERGDNLTITVAVSDAIFSPVANKSYFSWSYSKDQHQHVERITERTLELFLTNVSEKDMGLIGVRCWHCADYLTATIQLQVPVPIAAEFAETSHSDTELLVVHGYPIDDIELTISKDDDDLTERKWLSDTEDVVFFSSFIVRPEKRKVFYQRTFKIFTKDVLDVDHLSGNLSFVVCSQVSCSKVYNHVEQLTHETTTAYSGVQIRKVSDNFEYIFLAFLPCLLIFGLVCIYYREKLLIVIREKVHFFRKQLSWSQELGSRRASRETEETLLRLEERSSLSSSDYTNQIIPVIHMGNITIHEKIGKGAFGEVYCGSWEKLGDRSVAVKSIAQADQEVEKEALVLSRLDHPNIVRLFGMTRDKDNLLLVFEMMTLGDLRSYLRSRAPHPSNYSQFPPALLEPELKKIIVDVASGLCYLVAQQVVHRDLAARNCLVSGASDLRVCNPANRPPILVKISDFGMSRRLYSDNDYYRMEHQSLLPVRWLPPEAINDHKFSHSSDIWSFGVTMWEVFSFGQVPFSELSNQEVVSYAMAGMRPSRPKNCSKDVYDLMLRCWNVEPEKRMTAEDILLDPCLQIIRPQQHVEV